MKNWNYFELLATIYKSFFLYKEQGDSSEQAIARMGLDFWFYPENENIIENLILIITTISIKLNLFEKVDMELIKVLEKQLLLINEDLLSSQLKENEIEHLNESIEEVNYKINKMMKE